MAGAIAGWSPIERGHDDEEGLKFSRDRSKSDLSREPGVDIHPHTKSRDPILVEEPLQQALDVPPSQTTETTPAFGIGPFGDEPKMHKREEN